MVLLMVFVIRAGFTLFEDKLGANRFLPRGATVNKMVDLILRDGPVMKRAMCFSVALAQLIILSTELAYLGFYLHTAAAEDDD